MRTIVPEPRVLPRFLLQSPVVGLLLGAVLWVPMPQARAQTLADLRAEVEHIEEELDHLRQEIPATREIIELLDSHGAVVIFHGGSARATTADESLENIAILLGSDLEPETVQQYRQAFARMQRRAIVALRAALAERERRYHQLLARQGKLLEELVGRHGEETPADDPPTEPGTATYSTTYGRMTFTGSRSGKIATYSTDSGRIIGSINGRQIDGFWVESGSVRRCDSARDGSRHWGQFVVEFTPDYSSFSGGWGYCGQDAVRRWSGNR